jgi:hypothetical protein
VLWVVVFGAVWGGLSFERVQYLARDGSFETFVEAKKFELSVGEGASMLRLEERRRGFSHLMFLAALCSGWLSSTVEELVCNSG